MREPTVSRRGTGRGPVTAHRVLSAVELDVVWDGLGLGPTPVVLRLPSPGRTHAERRRLVVDTWAGLRTRGLAGPHGPEPELDRLLRLLAGPTERVELRGWGRTAVRAVAAGRDGTGVVVQRRGAAVVLQPCTSLPAAVVALLPAAPPGPGRAARMPTAVLAAARDDPSGAGLRADLVARGGAPDEAGPLARMLHGVDGRAQFGVLTPDRWGLLRRSADVVDVLDVLDGPRGRYLVTRGADGWTTVAPTDGRRLRHRVAELLAGPADRWVPGSSPLQRSEAEICGWDAQSRSSWRMSCRPDSVIEPDSDG